MSWRRVQQGIETLTLEVQPALCPVCAKVLYRNVTFLTGGWARCSICTEVIHYTCLSGGTIFKHRPRICLDCKAGRVRPGQKMPTPAVSVSPAPVEEATPAAVPSPPTPST
jgi:hypothetical protein